MKILFTFFLIFAFAFNSYSLPLVFKTTKEINSKSSLVELGSFDSSKYRQLRIRITVNPEISIDDVKSYEFSILGEEAGEEFTLASNASVVLDAPPSKIKVKVRGKGKFTLYIWGNQ